MTFRVFLKLSLKLSRLRNSKFQGDKRYLFLWVFFFLYNYSPKIPVCVFFLFPLLYYTFSGKSFVISINNFTFFFLFTPSSDRSETIFALLTAALFKSACEHRTIVVDPLTTHIISFTDHFSLLIAVGDTFHYDGYDNVLACILEYNNSHSSTFCLILLDL